MPSVAGPIGSVRAYRNSRLYRSLTRILRVYNRELLDQLHARGFTDFMPAFPSMLSNLDVAGTRIGVLATRAGVSRQAAGQLLREIERCGYVVLAPSPDDARVTIVCFTARGRRLLGAVFELVDRIERKYARLLVGGAYDRARSALADLADEIDPEGAFGAADVSPPGATTVPEARASRAARARPARSGVRRKT
jgi:DNA-binding MarR family transcriptional regulator